jgi:O-palmitoleoyl-L-serine hydrolase
VTGQSAGGLATFSWTNYIADHVPKGANVWSAPDSGIFLDSPNFLTQEHRYRMQFQNFMKFSNAEVDPPTDECVKENRNELWKCMFGEYLQAYIKVPLFPIQSLYDSWSLPNILGLGCGSGESLNNCNQGQMEFINQYRLNTSAVMKTIAKNSKNGGWAPACSNHVYSTGSGFYAANFRVPASSANSIAATMEPWLEGKDGQHSFVDEVAWPNNKPCSGIASSYLTVEWW